MIHEKSCPTKFTYRKLWPSKDYLPQESCEIRKLSREKLGATEICDPWILTYENLWSTKSSDEKVWPRNSTHKRFRSRKSDLRELLIIDQGKSMTCNFWPTKCRSKSIRTHENLNPKKPKPWKEGPKKFKVTDAF